MLGLARQMAIFTQKLERRVNIQPRGRQQSLVGCAHSGLLPPPRLDIHSPLSFFREYFAICLAKPNILLQWLQGVNIGSNMWPGMT